MYEKVKVYNEAFYDRQPRFIHASPKKVLKTVQNKQRLIAERRRENILAGLLEKDESLRYEIKEQEIWDQNM